MVGNETPQHWTPEPKDEMLPSGDLSALNELAESMADAPEGRHEAQRRHDLDGQLRDLERQRQEIIEALAGHEPSAETQAELEQIQADILLVLQDIFGSDKPIQ